MLTRLLFRARTVAATTGLETVLSGCDDHLLQDMGLLREPANHQMRAPAEFYAYDLTKFGLSLGLSNAA